jgi:hypothetical protein
MLQVEKHQPEIAGCELLERGDAFRRLVHVEGEAAVTEDLAHDAAHGAGIVHDQRPSRDLGARRTRPACARLRDRQALPAHPSISPGHRPPCGIDMKSSGAGRAAHTAATAAAFSAAGQAWPTMQISAP